VRANHSFALNKNTRHFFSSDFGICGSALGWLQSFVTGRYQYVAVGAQKFLKTICASGIPQGSEFSPLLFAMYILPISNVVTAHSLDHHQYADDTQLYMTVRPSAFTAVSECVEDVARWFLENGLLLNPAKTEAVLFGTKAQRDKILSARGIDITGTVVPFRNSVKLLGVTLDSVLTMDRHVTEVIRSCSYHTRALRHIRPLLTLDVAKMIGHSIVSSRLDYANALLHGTSVYNINRLQVAQNSLVRTNVKPLDQPVPPSCVVSFTCCQFDSGFPTRSLSSPTRHVPPANWLTSLTSCKTTDQLKHYDHWINCYCLHRGWR